jgi:hypothetical protein
VEEFQVGDDEPAYVGGETGPLCEVFPYVVVVDGEGYLAVFEVTGNDDVLPGRA